MRGFTSKSEDLLLADRGVDMRIWLFGLLALCGLNLSLAQVQDEPAAPWAQEAVEILIKKGVFIGYPDGTFRWKQPITREEAAIALYRLLAAYGIDQLSPEEIQRIKEALDNLLKSYQSQQGDIQTLRQKVEALKAQPSPSPANLAPLEERLARLEEAIKGIQAAQAALEARQLEDRIQSLEQKAKDLEERLKTLKNGGSLPDSKLQAQIQDLEKRVKIIEDDRTSLGERIKTIAEQLQTLPEAQKLLQEAQNRLASLESQTKAQEGRLARLEGRTDDQEEQIKSLKNELQALRENLLPERKPFYLVLGVYRGDVDEHLYGHFAFGNDALYGPLGLRVFYEGDFQRLYGPDSLLGADLTFRTSFGSVDGYFGVGGGLYLNHDPQMGFGQLVIGVDLRLFSNLAIFLEGYQRYLFDGNATQRSAIYGGLQVRF